MSVTPSLDSHLRSLESEELLRKADALRALMAHEGWEVVQELVDVQIAKVRVHLESGNLQTVQDYAFAGGTVKGLGQLRGLIDKTLKVAGDVRKALERV